MPPVLPVVIPCAISVDAIHHLTIALVRGFTWQVPGRVLRGGGPSAGKTFADLRARVRGRCCRAMRDASSLSSRFRGNVDAFTIVNV